MTPVAFYAFYSVLNRKNDQWVAVTVLSTFQLFGTLMCLGTEAYEGEFLRINVPANVAEKGTNPKLFPMGCRFPRLTGGLELRIHHSSSHIFLAELDHHYSTLDFCAHPPHSSSHERTKN